MKGKYASQKAWKKKNYDHVNKTNCVYINSRRKYFRALLLQEFGPCVMCGFSDPRALQFDHVHGGGNKEQKLTGRKTLDTTTQPKYAIVKARFYAGELQVLCANCNWVKRHENKEY